MTLFKINAINGMVVCFGAHAYVNWKSYPQAKPVFLKSNLMSKIISFKCEYCGNNDPDKARFYDGCIGYEAIICQCCGAYYDQYGMNEPDEWSINNLHYTVYWNI